MKMSAASKLVRTLAREEALRYHSHVIRCHPGRKHSNMQVVLEFENGMAIGYTLQELMAPNGA